MTRGQQCEAIVERIRAIAVNGGTVIFSDDFRAPYALTVDIDGAHTHVGGFWEGCDFTYLVNSLYGSLCEGRGLSWYPDVNTQTLDGSLE